MDKEVKPGKVAAPSFPGNDAYPIHPTTGSMPGSHDLHRTLGRGRVGERAYRGWRDKGSRVPLRKIFRSKSMTRQGTADGFDRLFMPPAEKPARVYHVH